MTDAGAVVFAFGKHKGKTFQEVFSREKGYVRWATELPEVHGQMKDFVDFCGTGGGPTGVPAGAGPPAVQQPSSSQPVGAAGPGPGGVPDAPVPAACGVGHRPPQYASPSLAGMQGALGGAAATSSSLGSFGQPAAGPPPVQPGPGQPLQRFALSAELSSPSEFRLAPAKPTFIPQPVWHELTRLAGGIAGGVVGDSKKEWRFPVGEFRAVLGQIRANPVLAACDIGGMPDWVVRLVQEQQVAGNVEVEAKQHLEQYLRALPPEVVQERPVMQFQKEGIRFGISRGGRCLLGDEMGLGKTLQALVIAAAYRREWPLLIVVPSALRLVWRDQALAWLPHLLQPSEVQVLAHGKQQVGGSSQLVVVSYDLLARNARFQLRADGKPYEVVVVDEAHYIKEPKSKRTGVVMQLCQAARRCILISGTPAVNRAVDLYTQLQALLPHGFPRFTQFCERYCERQEQKLPRGVTIVKWAGAKCKSELNLLLTQTVMIRRLKRDVLPQLPRKRRQRITLDASKLNTEKMKRVGHFLTSNLEAKLLEGDGAHDGPAPEIAEAFRVTAEAKVDGVAEYIEYLLGNDLKFLIFAHHHVMLDGVEEKLKAVGAKYIRIDGKTPHGQRANLVDSFQKDESVRIALLSITACGQGLTLTAASTVVFAELYWVPGQMMQAEDRVHRIGQQEMVDVHYCIAEGSLDALVFTMLNKKSRDTSGVLDGVERCMDAWNQRAAPSRGASEGADKGATASSLGKRQLGDGLQQSLAKVLKPSGG